MRYFTIIKLITYWLRVVTHDDKRYTKQCYFEQLRLADNNVTSWGLSVKNILCSTGFGFAWYNQGIENRSKFLTLFKQRLLDIDRQNWVNDITVLDLLRSYKIFKTESYVEPYSIHLDNIIYRRAIAMLRCGSLRIGIHVDMKDENMELL